MPGAADLPFPARPLSVGARRIDPALRFEPATAAELARSRADLARPGAVASLGTPEARVAEAAVASLVGAAEPTITSAAAVVAEDLCLLDEGLVLLAGAVAAPNRWRLAEKVGRPLTDIHAPVPGYAEHLAHPVARVLASLHDGRVLERRNWSVLDDPELFQPHDAPRLAADVEPGALWLRVERQTVGRLPGTTITLFTIRTRQWQLGTLDRAGASGLADAIAAAPTELLDYKGLAAAGPAVAAWLRRSARQ